jgi:hypothetical protein
MRRRSTYVRSQRPEPPLSPGALLFWLTVFAILVSAFACLYAINVWTLR